MSVRSDNRRWRQRGRVLLALAVPAAAAWLWWRRPLGLDAADVAAVEACPFVRLSGTQFGYAEDRTVRVTDGPRIAALIDVLCRGRRTTTHRCIQEGRLVLQYRSGRRRELQYLSGHDASCFEVRENGATYRMPRADFVSAMSALGLDVLSWSVDAETAVPNAVPGPEQESDGRPRADVAGEPG